MKLNERQTGILKFISENENKFLPSGSGLPPEVTELKTLGLLDRVIEIVDNFEGADSDMNKAAWKLTEAGRQCLAQL